MWLMTSSTDKKVWAERGQIGVSFSFQQELRSVGLQRFAGIGLYCSEPVNKIHPDGSREQTNPTLTSTESITSQHKQAELLKIMSPFQRWAKPLPNLKKY